MADYFGTDTVVSELRDDGLLIIRINRPEVANALNGVTSAAMENIMNHAETDKAVRAIVVTGTGKVFCAGEDLSELSEGGECQTVTEHGFGGLTARLCSKPVICACNGSAAGGGMGTVKVNGRKELLSVEIKPEAVDPDDIEMLEDLIVAATNEALRQVEQETNAAVSKMTGGFGGLGGGMF